MTTFVLVYIVFIAAAGLVVAGVVAVKPKLFWPMLIFVVVGTAGLTVPGYVALIDEYLTGCVLIGGLLAISVRGVSLRGAPRDDLSYLHMLIFSLMIIYMIVESVRGLLLWEDLRLSRWVVYYAMLGMLSFIISRGNFPVPNVKRMSLIILWSALLYFIAYLAHGFYTEEVRGISRFALTIQGNEWSGSAYAVFPLVVAIPAAIFLLKDSARSQRWLGWAVIIVVLIAGFFYDCRSAWIGVMAFLIVSPTVLRFRQTGLWLLILAGLAFFVFGYSTGFFQHLVQSALLRDVGEAGRLMMFQAAVNAVSANWIALFFGCGIHSHHFVIGQYLEAIGYGLLPSYVRVSGFAGLLIDIGLVGMLLLFMNFLFTALKVLAPKKSPGRVVLLLALLLAFVWPLIGKIDDIVLFYLMIMPSGLIAQLAGYKATEKPREEKY